MPNAPEGRGALHCPRVGCGGDVQPTTQGDALLCRRCGAAYDLGLAAAYAALDAALAAAPSVPPAAAGEDEVARLKRVIERDRTAYSAIASALREEIRSRRLISQSRGPYEWDDDEYMKEFGRALDAFARKLDAMERETHANDWTDSPTTDAEVQRARRELAPPRAAPDGAGAAVTDADVLRVAKPFQDAYYAAQDAGKSHTPALGAALRAALEADRARPAAGETTRDGA